MFTLTSRHRSDEKRTSLPKTIVSAVIRTPKCSLSFKHKLCGQMALGQKHHLLGLPTHGSAFFRLRTIRALQVGSLTRGVSAQFDGRLTPIAPWPTGDRDQDTYLEKLKLVTLRQSSRVLADKIHCHVRSCKCVPAFG